MKSLKSKLNEDFFSNAGGLVRPTTKDELMKEIRKRLRRHQTNLNDIDTNRITDMSNLFYEFGQNVDVSHWDTHNVTDMKYMFDGCTDFNCDLSRWDVSKVEDMENMFAYCENFVQDLSGWDTSNARFKYGAFNCSGVKKIPERF